MNALLQALTDDETTVLLIAAKGDSLAPIGRWEQPVKDLARRGLMYCHDAVNYCITDLGRLAVEDEEKRRDKALGSVVEKVARAKALQKDVADLVGQAAGALAQAARATSLVTGDSPEEACRKWAHVIYDRALEILRGNGG